MEIGINVKYILVTIGLASFMVMVLSKLNIFDLQGKQWFGNSTNKESE